MRDVLLACQRAASDPEQEGVPLQHRQVRIPVGQESPRFDGERWDRWQRESEPACRVLAICVVFRFGDLCTIEFEPETGPEKISR